MRQLGLRSRGALALASMLAVTLLVACDSDADKDDERAAKAGTAKGSSAAKAGPGAKVSKDEGAKKWAALLGLGKGKGKGAKGAKGPVEVAPAKPLPAGTLPSTLAQVVAQFTSFEKCLEQVQRRLPPDLGADMLKHYNIPDGLCRTREALARNDVSACNRAISYSLRKGCKIMLGIYRGQPELCPRGYPRRRGRDAYCVALASRDTSLCTASKKEAEEVRCQAILGSDRDRCTQLSRLADRAKCKSEVARWGSVVKAGTATLPKAFVPKLKLRLSMKSSGRPLPFTEVNASCARYGMVAPENGFTAQVNGCEYYGYGYRRNYGGLGRYSYNSPGRRTKVDFSFRPPQNAKDTVPFGPNDALLKIKVRRFGEFVSTNLGTIRFTRFERKRGGRVTGTFKTTLQGAGDSLQVEGEFDTFIRDLIPASEMHRRRKYGYGKYGRYGKYGKYGRLGSGKYGLSNPYRGGGKRTGLSGILGRMGRRPVGQNPYGTPRKRYAALLTAASLTQTTIGGKTGFQLSSIRPGSVWERLGIKDGDVVFRVGAIKLENQGAVVRIRKELRDAKSLKINLRRKRRGKTLRVSAQTLDRLRQEFRF